MKVEFYKHNLEQQDIDKAVEILHSTFLTTGKTVEEFEQKFSKYIGCLYTIGVNSCTAALFLSLKAYGIGKGDEVITTPMTFIATPNSIIEAGAKPVFVDVERETGNINTNHIEKSITKKTKAIMPVHLYGTIVNMVSIRDIADKYGLVVVEDAAHAIEGQREFYRVGELGETACFSFYPTKQLTCGDGGAIITNNKDIADKIYMMRNHGMNKDASKRYTDKYAHWDMEIFGYKSNMTNISAAFLLYQIDRIDQNWERRNIIAKYYESQFGNICMKVPSNCKPARLMFTILVNSDKRDDILHKLQDKGIGVAVNYRAIHLLKYYRKTFGYKYGDFPVAESIGDRTISIPLYSKLTDLEVEYVAKCVKDIIC